MYSRTNIHNVEMIRPQAGTSAVKKKLSRAAGRAAALAACLAFLALGDAFFTVKEIRVEAPADFSSAAAVKLSGIREGSSIFWFSAQKAARRLQAEPAVLSVQIRRSYPSTVVITIFTRVPSAYILSQGDFYIVDREGIVYEREGEINVSLPVVTGVDPEHLALGSPLQEPGRAGALKAFVTALAEVPGLELSELNLEDSEEMVLYTAAGVKVLLGDSRKMNHKLTLLKETLPYLTELGTGFCLDLRTGDRLVVIESR